MQQNPRSAPPRVPTIPSPLLGHSTDAIAAPSRTRFSRASETPRPVELTAGLTIEEVQDDDPCLNYTSIRLPDGYVDEFGSDDAAPRVSDRMVDVPTSLWKCETLEDQMRDLNFNPMAEMTKAEDIASQRAVKITKSRKRAYSEAIEASDSDTDLNMRSVDQTTNDESTPNKRPRSSHR